MVSLDICVSVPQSYVHQSVFGFLKITSKHQWIFTKLGMCIDIVEFRFGLLMGKFYRTLMELPV